MPIAPGDVHDWKCIGSTEDLVTYVTGIGGTECITVVGSFDPLRTTYGRREVTVTGDSDDVDDIQGINEEELRARVASRIDLRVGWIEGRGPWNFGDVWIGDIVDAALGPEFGGNADVRCISISVSLEPGRFEFIEMGFEAA